MNIKQCLKAENLPLSLIALMVATRFHHFGDVLHLPDASLAVFFFAGFYPKKMFFAFLLALAALIDYLAIENGTSGWCVTPAYVFLIPTYAVMSACRPLLFIIQSNENCGTGKVSGFADAGNISCICYFKRQFLFVFRPLCGFILGRVFCTGGPVLPVLCWLCLDLCACWFCYC